MSGNIVQSIIVLLLTCVVINRYFVPLLQNAIRHRRIGLIRSKLTLQNQLREARREYEQANHAYLDSFEKKVRWMDDAEIIFQTKMSQIRLLHQQTIDSLNDQFARSLNQVNETNRKNYLQDLIAIVSDTIHNHDVNYHRIVELIHLEKSAIIEH